MFRGESASRSARSLLGLPSALLGLVRWQAFTVHAVDLQYRNIERTVVWRAEEGMLVKTHHGNGLSMRLLRKDLSPHSQNTPRKATAGTVP
jgi:hypothetical protein